MHPRPRWLLKRTACIALAAASLLAASCTAGERDPLPARPNILLIVLDTFRSDRPGFAGGPAELTPQLDALARESTVFDDAVTTMATTFPAHASMFTGLSPRAHGVRWNGDALAPEAQTVAELLRDAGYDTAAFVSLRALLDRGGFAQGFSTTSADAPAEPGKRGEQRERAETGKRGEQRERAETEKRGERSERAETDVWSSAEITAMAQRWLRDDHDRPFFAWVHYFETHSPYEPTPYSDARLADYRGLLADGADAREILSARRAILRSPEHLRALRALYDGAVSEVDTHVGALFDTLRDSGLLERTVVVVTADHGQALGEHGALLHGGLLWDVALRVPLLIRAPGGCAGCRVRERTGVLDLAPTLLDFAGVETPASMGGRSLATATRGEPLSATPYYAETRATPGVDSRVDDSAPSTTALFLGRHKAIRAPGGLLLFDLEADPAELSPLDPKDHAALAREASALIAAYERQQPTRRSTQLHELEPEAVEALRALGYLE